MIKEVECELKIWIEYAKLMAALENEKTPANSFDLIRRDTIIETWETIAKNMKEKIKNAKRNAKRQRQL